MTEFMSAHLTLSLEHLAAHRIDAQLTLTLTEAQTLTLCLARWIPGSYLLRDFAKHLTWQQAIDQQGNPLELRRLDLNRWQLDAPAGTVHLYYHLYAFDASVRANYLCEHYAFINPAATTIWVESWRDQPYQLSIQTPTHKPHWQLHTTLPSLTSDQQGFGTYQAEDYDTLIEHPLLMGDAVIIDFEVEHLPHRMVLVDECPLDTLDIPKLTQDLTQLCRYEQTLWRNHQHPYPIDRYLFQVMVSQDGYGGLEHMNSTALMISRHALAYQQRPVTPAYDDFLALCAHEYFHLWLVKRIRPEGLFQPSFNQACITPMLWVFEGFTSLYDDWILYRSQCVSLATLLTRWSDSLTRTLTTTGAQHQSLAQASEEAWIKFYQPNENTANSQVSYYTRGMAVALLLQATLQQHGQHLDQLLHLWWHRWQIQPTQPLNPQQLQDDLSHLCAHIDWQAWLMQHVYRPDPHLDAHLTQALPSLGLILSQQQQPSLGVKLAEEQQRLIVKQVQFPSAALSAGLQVGDELIAINHWRLSNQQQLDTHLKHWQQQQTHASLTLTFARQGYLHHCDITPQITTYRYELSASNETDLAWLMPQTSLNKEHIHDSHAH